MPYGNPTSGGDENYSDGPDAMTKQASQSNSAHADETPAGNEDEPTGLLPKSILAGKEFQPGDELVLRIVRILDDQVEVQVGDQKSDSSEKGQEPPTESEPQSGDPQMQSMMD